MDNKYKNLIKTVEHSGKLIKNLYGQNIVRKIKSSSIDFVTEADLASEANILKFIKKNFPDYNVLSEEAGFIDKKSKYTFVLDPLDGTINFSNTIAFFTVTLSLLEGDKAIFAVTHNPLNNQTFYAFKGQGSYLNGKRIFINKKTNLSEAVVGFSCGWKMPLKEARKMMGKLLQLSVSRILNTWSPAWELCLLASGKIDGYLNYGNELYDNLAGKLIAREAGGRLTNFQGQILTNDRNNFFVASNNAKLHQRILKLL